MDITPGKDMVTPKHTSSYDEAFKHWFNGVHFQFPRFKHDHPAIVDVNKVQDARLTVGDRIADKVAATVGSWPFIITQSCLLAAWIILNLVAWFSHWDPYPFILLNLALSFQAAYAAPFVMMSQNRQSSKDRLTAENDYKCDLKGEQELVHIMEHLDHQDTLILQVIQRLEAQHQEMLLRMRSLDPEMVKRLGADLKQVRDEEVGNGDIAGNS